MPSSSGSRSRFVWPSWAVPALKSVLHISLLLPLAYLLWQFHSGALALLPDPVSSITHLTGNVALWILLGSLAVTPVRRLHPVLSPLVRVRRLLGLYAFFYATLHLATYVFLFSGFDLPAAIQALLHGRLHALVEQWKAVWPTMVDDLKRRRFIQVGLFAWVILLLLALTSPAAALRALGGPMWRRIHRLVYVAAIAAVIHYWWLVKAGNYAPWRDTALLAVLFASRLAYVAYTRWKRSGQPTSTEL